MTSQSDDPGEATSGSVGRNAASLAVESASTQTERAFILSMSRNNRWMLAFSVAIAFVGLAGAALLVIILAKQLGVMSAQLEQMQAAVGQTERLIGDFHHMADVAAQSTDIARQANETNKQILSVDRRAWIAPKGADLVGTFEAGKPLAFTVSYGNTGKEPATDLAINGIGALAPAPANGAWETFVVSQNQSCQGSRPSPAGPWSFPRRSTRTAIACPLAPASSTPRLSPAPRSSTSKVALPMTPRATPMSRPTASICGPMPACRPRTGLSGLAQAGLTPIEDADGAGAFADLQLKNGSSRSMASASLGVPAAKQRRKNCSPPAPNALPGARPTRCPARVAITRALIDPTVT